MRAAIALEPLPGTLNESRPPFKTTAFGIGVFSHKAAAERRDCVMVHKNAPTLILHAPRCRRTLLWASRAYESDEGALLRNNERGYERAP
ncbi:unnamed protein product, partial [Iphiclides podalirius]